MNDLASHDSIDVHAVFIDEGVAKLLFRNPSRRHSLSAKLLKAIEERLTHLAEQNVSVVVLTSGIGEKVWSAGHDISELADDRDPVGWGKPLERLLRKVRNYPGVIIGMVSGSAWGGAVDLAMSCDLIVADTSACFVMTPANIGLPYSTSGLLRFFGNLPVHILKEMFFCARPLDAERAERFGVVNRLVKREELENTTFAIAREIVSKAPLAIRAVKEQLRIIEDARPVPVDAMEQIAELRRAACAGSDMREGLEAFAQRRIPHFKGE
ncbi:MULTISPECIES: methylmalonyl-CoA decarboxylase [Burkholderia cepacia complex]|uniref:methylmalonyl-CoA decarboxylase n=1 Tax=Burkholderia cepacia complex TaxID=87882 RepID=UPI0026DF04FB|nr:MULTISPECIES: methylmalonyl-CoA decarboxylase [Burkholderia cepacia complex]MDO5948162.1 methylmalonyl-CoA decarboxylase [Burkholderia cepacia]MDS0803601.1 methylmalonyl-CoA decarboxylase [Burkholderia cenocepacia]